MTSLTEQTFFIIFFFAAFTIAKFKISFSIIREDLMNAVYHPRRLAFHLKLGHDIFDDENV